ncbi:glycoside hydrolase family 78, partial [Candidatus Fermentibacteria bacterium]|nr:glycoside hydrolase family 78 [Candidatus Fermentibacteria bacterium]
GDRGSVSSGQAPPLFYPRSQPLMKYPGYDIPPGVEILRLGYRETSFATEFTGSFACDDSFYTALWHKAANTLRVSMRDGIQDPDRERAQWWGDAVTIAGQIFYCCDTRAHSLVRKAMRNLVDWRRADGVLYSPVPSGSWNKEVPCQMLAAVGIQGFWTYYMATGDKETIRYVYPHVRGYLNLWSIGGDGLLVPRAGDWDWVDWGDNQDRDMIEVAWYCMALESAERMATVCGDTADARAFPKRRAGLIRSVNRRWWRRRSGYRSPRHISSADDRANGLAVVAGIADRSKWGSLRRLLARQSHASPYMEKYVLEAFFVMGDAFGGLARMKRRYAGMVESDLTTLWEHWYRVGESYNHGWAGGPLTLLSQYVLGVAPLEPGYGRYRLMPQMGPLRSVDATVPTIKGPIVVHLERADSSFILRMHSPPGTAAMVGIPRYHAVSWERITANGYPVWGRGGRHGHLEGVEFDTPSPTHLFFGVAPGEWEFKASP